VKRFFSTAGTNEFTAPDKCVAMELRGSWKITSGCTRSSYLGQNIVRNIIWLPSPKEFPLASFLTQMLSSIAAPAIHLS
jgi:hypothetical protein